MTSSKATIWGNILIGLVTAVLLADAAVAFLSPGMLAGELATTGWSAASIAPIGVLDVVLALLCAVPRTTPVGAIATTGFFGGAIATHARMGDALSPPAIFCATMIVFVWGGLWLRDARVRALLPLAANPRLLN